MLSQQRMESILQGQTGLARRVYDAIPISQRWNQSQIANELTRLGKPVDFRVLSGCLTDLVDAKAISCNNGTYMREPVRPTPVRPIVVEPQPKEATMSKSSTITLVQPANPIQIDPVDRLGKIAALLRGAADEVDELALDVQQTLESNQAALGKFKQLQTLLKDL